jgi:hypothetical protein
MEELNIEEMTALRGGGKHHHHGTQRQNGTIQQEHSQGLFTATQDPAITVIQVNTVTATQDPAITVIQVNDVRFG